jgi:hypothetical protein
LAPKILSAGLRLQSTPNAEPTKENIRLIGNNDDPSLEEIVLAKIADHTKHKPRKDAVLCSEIFFSASPKYFRCHDPSHAGDTKADCDFEKSSKYSDLHQNQAWH